MAHILILGGGAAGLAAALAAAQTDPTARVTVLETQPPPGRKRLLATGNGRCNLDNEGDHTGNATLLLTAPRWTRCCAR